MSFGTGRAEPAGMQFNSIEEFEVWQVAARFVAAVSAATGSPAFGRELKLREQINDSLDSILSNMAEGYEQGTDPAFARYLAISRGSCGEARSHLLVAQVRGLIPAAAASAWRKDATQVSRMLTGLIDYLRGSDHGPRGLRRR